MTKRILFFMLVCGTLVPRGAVARSARGALHQFASETAQEMTGANLRKGSDRFGKIADELMDKVYAPAWRHGQFHYRPGVQAAAYELLVRVFIDKAELDMKQAAETQF